MLTLYGINLSTFTRKVRFALAEKAIAYRFEVAAMGSPKVRGLHPLGKIPVMEDDGLVVPDSSVIIAYLEKAYPARPLYPDSAGDLARALWLEEYADTKLREATVPFFAENVVKPLFMGKEGDAKAIEKALGPRDESFGYLESELDGADFFVGDRLGVADIAVAAQLVTCQQGGGEIDPARWPALAGFLARLRVRPALAPLLAEEDQALAAARARRP